ncbi:hypothetical protein COO60DRAFT_1294622, partial [Scenedesmus sp. NREL 46B-D3]
MLYPGVVAAVLAVQPAGDGCVTGHGQGCVAVQYVPSWSIAGTAGCPLRIVCCKIICCDCLMCVVCSFCKSCTIVQSFTFVKKQQHSSMKRQAGMQCHPNPACEAAHVSKAGST